MCNNNKHISCSRQREFNRCACVLLYTRRFQTVWTYILHMYSDNRRWLRAWSLCVSYICLADVFNGAVTHRKHISVMGLLLWFLSSIECVARRAQRDLEPSFGMKVKAWRSQRHQTPCIASCAFSHNRTHSRKPNKYLTIYILSRGRHFHRSPSIQIYVCAKHHRDRI